MIIKIKKDLPIDLIKFLRTVKSPFWLNSKAIYYQKTNFVHFKNQLIFYRPAKGYDKLTWESIDPESFQIIVSDYPKGDVAVAFYKWMRSKWQYMIFLFSLENWLELAKSIDLGIKFVWPQPLAEDKGYCTRNQKEAKPIIFPVAGYEYTCPLCLDKVHQLEIGDLNKLYLELLKENPQSVIKKLKLDDSKREEIEFALEMGVAWEEILRKLIRKERL